MPKPTFLQSVLRKPSRSYADPSGASPWAEDSYSYASSTAGYRPTRYDSRDRLETGSDFGYYPSRWDKDRSSGGMYVATAPPKQKYSSQSVVSNDVHSALRSRFPAPRKASSSLGLEPPRAEDLLARQSGSAESTPRKKKVRKAASDVGRPSSRATTARPGSRLSTIRDDDETVATATAAPRKRTVKKKAASVVGGPSHDPLGHSKDHAVEQQVSRAAKPRPALSAIQRPKTIVDNIVPPLTPPSSDFSVDRQGRDGAGSSPHGSVNHVPSQPEPEPLPSVPVVVQDASKAPSPFQVGLPPAISAPPKPPKSKKRLSIASTVSEGDEEGYHTPRDSLVTAQSTLPTVPAVPEPADTVVHPPPPVLHIEPPTPMPAPDIETRDSPFVSTPSSSISSTVSSPQPPLPPQPSIVVKSPTPGPESLPVVDDDDVESATGEVGSDAEEESARRSAYGEHSRHSSFSNRPPSRSSSQPRSTANQPRSKSRPSSRAASVMSGDGMSRSARHYSNPSMPPMSVDGWGGSRHSATPSEVSIGRQSLRSGISGYGKGGWAAAHTASRSTTPTPGMMMPSGASDGFEHFIQAPPRQSKFTPLPPASQPPTFDHIVHGKPRDGSSVPSAYSQDSDDDEEGPTPSRSYAKREVRSESGYSEPRSQSSRHQNGFVLAPSIDAPVPPPKDNLLRQSLSRLRTSASNSPSGSLSPRQCQSPYDSREASPSASPYLGPSASASPVPTSPSRLGFEPPSFLNPDTLTVLPEMTPEDSARTYEKFEPHRSSSVKRATSVFGLPRSARSEVDFRGSPSETVMGRLPSRSGSEVDFSRSELSQRRPHTSMDFRSSQSEVAQGRAGARSAMDFRTPYSPQSPSRSGDTDYEDERDEVPELPRRAQSAMGYRAQDFRSWEGSSAGESVLMESNGRTPDTASGYTTLVLPAGAYRPKSPAASTNKIDPRILGLPHSSMAAITLATQAPRDTPTHLRDQHPPVDFSSHIPPPTKVSRTQVLVQVYAAAVDFADVRSLDDKPRGEIGKWIPGRSFVGRCLTVGEDEKDIVRGDIVVGLMDIRKSGALAEYIVCERRRLARAPHPTPLTLEQMALLPLQGIVAARTIRTHLVRNRRALVMNAHEGVPALICQELSRAGVHVTAIIPGGEGAHIAQSSCMNNGARGVLTGSPAAIMLTLDEGGWDFILDTYGGQRVYEAARKILKNGAKLVTLVPPDPKAAYLGTPSKLSGLKALRAAFKRRKDSKYISFEYVPPAGTGEPEVDNSGEDCRDVLEQNCMRVFRPVVSSVVPFERGAEAFMRRGGVVRMVN